MSLAIKYSLCMSKGFYKRGSYCWGSLLAFLLNSSDIHYCRVLNNNARINGYGVKVETNTRMAMPMPRRKYSTLSFDCHILLGPTRTNPTCCRVQ